MAQEFLEEVSVNNFPRLPLEGHLDLTYRCNNNCRHCWLRIPSEAKEKKDELSFEQIIKITGQARPFGCRKWSISGGEPMLRPDFAQIFDYLTAGGRPYSINTNATLITPKIAALLRRKGVKMVALYGATAEVHDHITRTPGSFAAAMRGFRYLKEAGAGFTVQLVPMRENYHQFKDMVNLAQSLSKSYRLGAAWLHLSACGDKKKNMEIMRQRLPPETVTELDQPDPSFEGIVSGDTDSACRNNAKNGYLFSACIAQRRDFHIDPYGKMTFCSFIKDPALRYDLKRGTFKEAWEEFIPSLARKVQAAGEYRRNCGSCEYRKDCRNCPVYSFLEHRDFNRKVEYLCAAAKESRKFREDWAKNHRRYFEIARITIQVESDLAFNEGTFHPKFKIFEVNGPGRDTIAIRHHFSLPEAGTEVLGQEVYRKTPWAIYKNNGSWIYLGILPDGHKASPYRVAVFNSDHSRARIYNDEERKKIFLGGNLDSLTLFPSDQILLARILADRGGFCLHSCGVSFRGRGLVFAGHSGAGKSTIAEMLKGRARILCDDRIIVREHRPGFRIYGTWSHGDVKDISAHQAPLKAIMFPEKARRNRLIPVRDKKEAAQLILTCLIKPFVTADWWEKTLLLVDKAAREIPCYKFEFDKSGEGADVLERLARSV
jgi:radical SAM protein with 4Fe4S-binding SPASM domain